MKPLAITQDAGTHAQPVVINPLAEHDVPVVPASSGVSASPLVSPLLTCDEAAAYLRKSVSWLMHVRDIPVLRGRPNLYDVADLNAWIERHKHRPKARA